MKKTISIGIVLTLVFTAVAGMIAFPGLAHTESDPFEVTLWAGQNIDAGIVSVWNDGTDIHVTYETIDGWEITETHLYVGKTDPTMLTSAPGQFPYSMSHEPSVTEYTYVIDLCDIDSYSLEENNKGKTTGKWVADGIAECFDPCDEVDLFIAAHAVVMDMSCYQTAVLYGLERFTGTVYGIDVLTGDSWVEFDIESPPTTGSATPNGLAYDAVNERFYYCDYYSPNKLYFWDTIQHDAGSLIGNVADADFYNGKYYYISGPPASDDLYVVEFETDGTIKAGFPAKVDDIADNLHGWTFSGDIAIKDDVVYGWGYCNLHGYEFFTYDLTTSAFTVNTVSYSTSLQLGFGSDGTLYGHRSGGAGAFYVIDTTNGDVSMVTPTPDPVHLYTDCSSGEICVPNTETAWGDGDPIREDKNWAMYFGYTTQCPPPVEMVCPGIVSKTPNINILTTPPLNVQVNTIENNDYFTFFKEFEGPLTADLQYDLEPGRSAKTDGPSSTDMFIEEGTEVCIFYIQLDNVGTTSTLTKVGSITFGADIMGAIISGGDIGTFAGEDLMFDADDILKPFTGITYPVKIRPDYLRGFDVNHPNNLDDALITGPTIDFTMWVVNAHDSMRIIVPMVPAS